MRLVATSVADAANRLYSSSHRRLVEPQTSTSDSDRNILTATTPHDIQPPPLRSNRRSMVRRPREMHIAVKQSHTHTFVPKSTWKRSRDGSSGTGSEKLCGVSAIRYCPRGKFAAVSKESMKCSSPHHSFHFCCHWPRNQHHFQCRCKLPAVPPRLLISIIS